ncbi:MAG: hypothetical protein RLW61_17830 [Gammaproteobacteria bacterium]
MSAIVAFWLLAALVCSAPFLPAIIEWIARTDAQPLVVVREQDTNIRHFALGFCDRVQDLLEREGIDADNPPADHQGEYRPGERFRVLGASSPPSWPAATQRSRVVDVMLVALRDLLLEGGFVYAQEVYARGQIVAGSNATYRALYGGTDVLLGDGCTVARWLHSQGHVHIGADCTVYGRVSSGLSMTLGAGTRFERLNAPLIRFASDGAVRGPAAALGSRRTPWPDAEATAALHALDERTLRAAGDLVLPTQCAVRNHLVARGNLLIGAGSRVDGNLKAREQLVSGAGSVLRGAVVCRGAVVLGEGCLVKGPVISESEVVVAAGCVVGTPAMPTTITAPRIHVAAGSQVSGTIWATEHGLVETATADTQTLANA